MLASYAKCLKVCVFLRKIYWSYNICNTTGRISVWISTRPHKKRPVYGVVHNRGYNRQQSIEIHLRYDTSTKFDRSALKLSRNSLEPCAVIMQCPMHWFKGISFSTTLYIASNILSIEQRFFLFWPMYCYFQWFCLAKVPVRSSKKLLILLYLLDQSISNNINLVLK